MEKDEDKGTLQKYYGEVLKGLDRTTMDQETRLRALEKAVYERVVVIEEYIRTREQVNSLKESYALLEKDFQYQEKRQVKMVTILTFIATTVITVGVRLIEKLL